MMLFLHSISFQSQFLPISSIKVPTFSIKFYTFLNFELNAGRVFETPDLKQEKKILYSELEASVYLTISLIFEVLFLSKITKNVNAEISFISSSPM